MDVLVSAYADLSAAARKLEFAQTVVPPKCHAQRKLVAALRRGVLDVAALCRLLPLDAKPRGDDAGHALDRLAREAHVLARRAVNVHLRAELVRAATYDTAGQRDTSYATAAALRTALYGPLDRLGAAADRLEALATRRRDGHAVARTPEARAGQTSLLGRAAPAHAPAVRRL